MLSQKCAILLLDAFTKIYHVHHQYPFIKFSSKDSINTYKLPLLGYKITDRHLPRGFVTSRKPNTAILCDYVYCNSTNDLLNGSVLTCGHGYHSLCLQRCQFKCLIYMDYLQGKVKKNVDAQMTSFLKTKSSSEEFIREDSETEIKNDLDDAEETTDDGLAMEDLLESAKKSFIKL